MSITLETAELLGALAGEGFIGNYGKHKNQFIIEIAGHSIDDKNYLEYISKIIKQLVPKTSIRYRQKGNSMWMYTYSKKLFHILKDKYRFPVGKKGNKLEIINEIKNSNKHTRMFIRGLFDTDGCTYLDKRKSYTKPYPRIRLEITSQKLFKEIANYLNKEFKTYEHLRKRPKYQQTQILEIYGHKQLQK